MEEPTSKIADSPKGKNNDLTSSAIVRNRSAVATEIETRESGTGEGSAGFQSLPVNVWETPDGYQAALLAPGLDEQSINVTVHDDTLAIEGELKFNVPEGARPIWQEFGPSKFRRSLRLGAAVDPTRVEAIYRNGLLMVTMPKAEHAKPRQVRVQVGNDAAPATPSKN